MKARRPRTVIDHIIEHGAVTTEELQSIYGYDHPPRAVRDVREQGIPIETFQVRSKKTTRWIAGYRFGSPDDIIQGRIGGRKAFSSRFRKELLERYDSRDAITGEQYESRYLQIDHRVPYEVAGESAHDEDQPNAYMLLTASSQRAKSWSCERCPNWRHDRDAAVCGSCFWAFPDNYTHVAGDRVRRVDIEWHGSEVEIFERIRNRAESEDATVAAFIKRLAERAVG